MKLKNILQVVAAILVCQLVGVIGSFFTAPAIESWYAFLNKPSFNPPNWLFAPMWFLLYTLMGVAVYLIWQKRESEPRAKLAMRLFLIHLFFNALWSILFFGLQNIWLALVDIVVILILIVILIIKFAPIDKRASYLLVPYLAWVSFATLLNLSILVLN